MGKKVLTGLEMSQEDLYDLQYIERNGRFLHVTELEDRTVTVKDLCEMRMNRYARDLLPSKLTNRALIREALDHYEQCGEVRRPCATYEDTLVHVILPELLKRLEELLGEDDEGLGDLENKRGVPLVCGVEVMDVVSDRVKRGDRVQGLYYYDLRHGDNPFEPVTVENKVKVNRYGTLITKEPINLGEEGYRELTESEVYLIINTI